MLSSVVHFELKFYESQNLTICTINIKTSSSAFAFALVDFLPSPSIPFIISSSCQQLSAFDIDCSVHIISFQKFATEEFYVNRFIFSS